jgi:hypothetical protein
MDYFRPYDHFIKAKLIYKLNTNQSKQWALLFCSSFEVWEEILWIEHVLHKRRLRIEYARSENKGKKTTEFFAVQISGLDPNWNIQDIYAFFKSFPTFSRGRLIQGLHPKQKKVAIIHFTDKEIVSEILSNSHMKIGTRNWRVAEYTKEKPEISRSEYFGNETYKNNSYFLSNSTPWNTFNTETDHQDIIDSAFDLYKKQPKEIEPSNSHSNTEHKKLKPLNLDAKFKLPKVTSNQKDQKGTYRKYSDSGCLHPVEVENDDLFRIFWDPPKLKLSHDAKLDYNAQKKGPITESKETADE